MQKSLICRHITLKAALLLAISLTVHAERADRDKPVNIEADKMNADDNKKSTHFQGRVVLTQGTIRLTADNMTVREDGDGFKYASAYGDPVTFRQKREGVNEWVDGIAQHVEYNGKLDRIELFDKAIVHRDKDEIRGNYLSYDTKSEFLQARGAGNSDGGQAASNGRVHVTLQPKKDKTKSGSALPSQPLKRDPDVAP